jgi:hypothetical protein
MPSVRESLPDGYLAGVERDASMAPMMSAFSKTLFCWSATLAFIVLANTVADQHWSYVCEYLAGTSSGLALGKWLWTWGEK